MTLYPFRGKFSKLGSTAATNRTADGSRLLETSFGDYARRTAFFEPLEYFGG
jgi:hypothetical protein